MKNDKPLINMSDWNKTGLVPQVGDNEHSYLILLRELEIVVCLQALDLICQLRDGDGRVTCHACRAQKNSEKLLFFYSDTMKLCSF